MSSLVCNCYSRFVWFTLRVAKIGHCFFVWVRVLEVVVVVDGRRRRNIWKNNSLFNIHHTLRDNILFIQYRYIVSAECSIPIRYVCSFVAHIHIASEIKWPRGTSRRTFGQWALRYNIRNESWQKTLNNSNKRTQSSVVWRTTAIYFYICSIVQIRHIEKVRVHRYFGCVIVGEGFSSFVQSECKVWTWLLGKIWSWLFISW